MCDIFCVNIILAYVICTELYINYIMCVSKFLIATASPSAGTDGETASILHWNINDTYCTYLACRIISIHM